MEIVKAKNLTWIDIQNPTIKDVKFLKDNFNFHPLVLEEIIPPASRTKVENYNYGDYLFIIFHIPFLNRKERKIEALELDVIISKTHVITNHYHSILPLKALFDQCNLYEEARAEYMNIGSGYLLYYIMERIFESVFPKLEFLEDEIDEVEDQIFKGKEREMVYEISMLKRAVIDFRRIVESQRAFTQFLTGEGKVFFGEKLQPYFYVIVGSYNKIVDILQTQKETIEALESTNQGLLSTKINEVMRVLTAFSAVTLPLSLIANIFGMNLDLPIHGGEAAAEPGFWIVMALMISSAGALYMFFKHKRWI